MCTLGVPLLLQVCVVGLYLVCCTCTVCGFVSTCLRMLGVYHHHVPLPSQRVSLVGGLSLCQAVIAQAGCAPGVCALWMVTLHSSAWSGQHVDVCVLCKRSSR
jgi:hypothetical protein